jgi:DNA polymerase IV
LTRTASSPGQRAGEGCDGDRRARRRFFGGGGPLAQDHPYRHGCFLRIRRTARQPGAARQAGRGRRIARARGRRGGKLRGTEVWRSFGDALNHAKRKCPDLIFVKPRFDAYKTISLQIQEIFAEYTPVIEPLSLDEAHLDVTENLKGIVSATQIAEEILAKIRAETELTASAGVSYNKFLAKLASDHRKPDGLFVITPKMGPAFVETLPVKKFHGVGPATARKMSGLGIETGLDLKGQTLEFLQQHFGKVSSYYYWAARGVDERPVRADRIRKSVGAENTFPADLFAYEAARDALREIVDKVWDYCDGSGIRGRTVTLKVKFANFQIITRSRTGQIPVRTRSELEQLGGALLEPLFPVARGIRLLGISMSSLAAEEAEPPEFSLPV